jgi:hypothetical protein
VRCDLPRGRRQVHNRPPKKKFAWSCRATFDFTLDIEAQYYVQLSSSPFGPEDIFSPTLLAIDAITLAASLASFFLVVKALKKSYKVGGKHASTGVELGLAFTLAVSRVLASSKKPKKTPRVVPEPLSFAFEPLSFALETLSVALEPLSFARVVRVPWHAV